MMNILEELSIVSNFPQLRERAMLNICSWKAEHENVYKEFKNKMDNVSAGDLSALDAMFGLASDCLPDKPAGKKVSSLPDFGSAEGIWQRLPQYAKSYIAEVSKEDGKATKDECLSLIEEATDYMNTCMSFVPSFVSNLKAKAMDEENDVIRCMYYYMMFDGGSTKMIETLNTILTDDILDQERAHYSLGLFLVQYLGNGFNLVDVGQLTYSQYYFDTERKAFKFYRKKTRGRSTNGSEVIIPITEPLQRILDDIAAPLKLNAYVFPHVLEGATHERDIRKRVSGENSNVQDRVIKICKDVLHWEVRPSGTWARHSFATNLTHAGVERSYIQESMGHSQSQSVTDRYIANYPLEKQMEYNSKLLNLNPTPTITKNDIKKMSKAEMAALLTELMEK